MARRRLIWHIGLDDPTCDVIGVNLQAYRAALAERGLRVLADADEGRRAVHEVRRTRREAGLTRREVEGTWARVARRAWDHRGTSVLSTAGVAGADQDQLRFALDQLGGIEVHLVVAVDALAEQLRGGWLAERRRGTAPAWEDYVAQVAQGPAGAEHPAADRFWAGHDLAAVLARWGWTLHGERVHVLAVPDPAERWAAYLAVAGVPDGPPPVLPAPADPGVAVLREPLPELDRLVARWGDAVEEGGHDLHGELRLVAPGALVVK